MRACIGRAFAWQEALLVVAILLQNFNLSLDNPNYVMKVDQTLTIKPKDFEIRASLRPGITATELNGRLSSTSNPTGGIPSSQQTHSGGEADTQRPSNPIEIVFGTTTGTCQSLAQRLAARLSHAGWQPTVTDMDAAISKIGRHGPVIFITSSYEGQAPDNALSFVAWLESITENKTQFEGVQYAVYGCGHSDWSQTYQRIPTLIDDIMSSCGASRLAERGIADAAKGDVLGSFENWVEKDLLAAISSSSHMGESVPGASIEPPTVSPAMQLETELSSQERATHLGQDVQWATVTKAMSLTPPGQPQKRHIEIELPKDMSYNVGDYLVVLPTNSDDQVHRVMKKFSLPWDSVISITKRGSTTLPVNAPLPVSEILKGYVELSQPASLRVSATPYLTLGKLC
jgi:cytochrome P450 / NADPH-cytochrome P450 reductase